MNVQDWGLIDFSEAWRRQRELVDAILRSNQPDTLVLCEHPAVITLGRNSKEDSVSENRDVLAAHGIDIVEINRGGEATVHSPGQLTIALQWGKVAVFKVAANTWEIDGAVTL